VDKWTKENEPAVGVVAGLAVTPFGGEVLSVEASLFPGKGSLQLTGQLGDVMKESVQAAYSYARAHAEALGIPATLSAEKDVHVHVPSGAIPKDGPSAGVAMATALVSAMTNTSVRNDVAMTGEVTLRGRVLKIGGVKEKVMAAQRAGLTTIILPKSNEVDVEDIPEEVRKQINLHFVEEVDEVLKLALVKSSKATATKHKAATVALA
jgi:ATP-dependent Lon protease